jgi:hypothetical protein
MGAVPAEGVVTDGVRPLRDYEAIRRIRSMTIDVVEVTAPSLVLGSGQSAGIVRHAEGFELRRRRGGGGVVLLRPGDLWIDAWIPADDVRWDHDVRRQSMVVGEWWRVAIATVTGTPVTLFDGPARPGPAPSACFASLAPGEVTYAGAKLVGLSQWRAREGALVAGVLPIGDSRPLARHLTDRVEPALLAHPSQASLGLLGRTRELARAVVAAAGAPIVQTSTVLR